MKSNIVFLLLVAAGLCSLNTVAAEGLPAPLIEVAKEAVSKNPEVQSRWRAFNAADADQRLARAGYKPQINAGVGTGRIWDAPTNLPSDQYWRTTANVSLTQMLFDGRLTRSEVSRLGYTRLTRYYELLDTSDSIALEAIRAYADVARYTELVQEAQRNYAEHQMVSKQINERAAAGVSRRVDVEQANGRLALAQSNFLTEVSNLHDVSARYLRIVGQLPPDMVASLPDDLQWPGVPDAVADALQQGLERNPAINAAYENMRAAESRIQARKAAYAPKVNLVLSHNRERNVNGVRGTAKNSALEVVLDYNLYRGGADEAAEVQAVELHHQAIDLKDKACRDARQTLTIAHYDRARLREQIRYLEQHRLSSEKAREAYRQQFDIGQRTLLDLLDTQNEYFQASRAYINAHYDEVVAQARTLQAMGQLTASLGVSHPQQPTLEDAGQDRDQLPAEVLCAAEAPTPYPWDRPAAP